MTTNNKPDHKKTFLKKQLPIYIKMASSLSLVVGAMSIGVPTFAQTSAADEDVEEVIVSGQRGSIQSAQMIKRDASVIVDSIVAEDIGKLPDRSVTEALQRVPGITVSRYDTPSDPEHFAGEGSGVAVRGLTQVRAELNGRDVFSANDGRALGFDDVPAELMAGVDTYKSPSAELIEGGMGGTVNLRTRMPFDSDGQVIAVGAKANYGDQIDETNGEYSALYGNRWETDLGEFGLLVNLSASELASRADNVYNRAFMPRDDVPGHEGDVVFLPRGADWRRNDYHREREGQYVALQWAPNDTTEVYLTGFRSKHNQQWNENAFFTDNVYGGNFKQVPVEGANDWVIEDNVLRSGTIATANDFGIGFGTSTRLSNNTSTTTDYSLGVKWSPDDNWKFNADLQHVQSESEKEDLTLGLIVYPETMSVSNVGGLPDINIDSAYMSDYSNYSFGQMMSMPADNEADATVFKADGEYSFEDSIIKSVKVGARFTDKTAENREASQWQARYQPWQTGWLFPTTADIPKVTEDQAAQFLTLYSFKDFYRGDINVPQTAYLIESSLLKDFRGVTDAITAVTPDGAGSLNWDTNLNLDNPDNINTQKEKTAAAYFQVNYGFDDLAMPVYGNVGVRLVQTDNAAIGQIKSSGRETADGVNPFDYVIADFEAKNSYTNILPSLNVKVQVTDDVIVRFAAAETIWRPEFWRMKALYNLSADLKSGLELPVGSYPTLDQLDFELNTDGRNPTLEPMKATQFDVTAEWYFDDRGGMAHLALFTKDLTDMFQEGIQGTTVIGNPTYGPITYDATWTDNGGDAEINGIEIGFTKFFDFLPEPFDGFGVNANYTYIDSESKIPTTAEPTDTDGSTFGDLPYVGISKNSFNIIGMYEKNGFSGRLAYNWRSKYLVTSGPNGWNSTDPWQGSDVRWMLPIYNDDYGQLDMSLGYTFLDNYTVAFDVYNLTKEETKGIMDQNGAGENFAYYYSQDVRYTVSLRATF